MVGYAGLHGINQHKTVDLEILVEVCRDLVHFAVVGRMVAPAHDDDQVVVAADVARKDQEILPFAEFGEPAFDGVFRVDVAEEFERFAGCVEDVHGSGISGNIPYLDQPERKSDLFFRIFRYHDQVALDGGQRLSGFVDQGGGVAFGEDALGEVAQKSIGKAFLVVQPEDEVRDLVFFDHSRDPVDDVRS